MNLTILALLFLQAMQASPLVENDFVRVFKSSAPCASAAASCGDRVLVALGAIEVNGQKMERGEIKVFKSGDRYTPPATGDFLLDFKGPVNIKTVGPATIDAEGAVLVKSAGQVTVEGAAQVTVEAPQIILNGDVHIPAGKVLFVDTIQPEAGPWPRANPRMENVDGSSTDNS